MKEEDIERATFLRELLKFFGANLYGFGAGVSANLIGKPAGLGVGGGYWGEHLDFRHTEWLWLEPLLLELRARRDGKFVVAVEAERGLRPPPHQSEQSEQQQTGPRGGWVSDVYLPCIHDDNSGDDLHGPCIKGRDRAIAVLEAILPRGGNQQGAVTEDSCSTSAE